MKSLVEIAFEKAKIAIPLKNVTPVKLVSAKTKKTVKYKRIAVSVKEEGIVEPLIVTRTGAPRGKYVLLDGHMRLEVMKALGWQEAPCLVAKDDEAFTYNKRINRLASVQEHFMILRAIENGVSEERIAKALGVRVSRIREKRNLLTGICSEAVDILKDRHFPAATANVLKRVKPIRQIEMAELMVAAGNYSLAYARALYMASHPDQLLEPGKKKKVGEITDAERDKMEREMASLHRDIKAVEDNYGTNMLCLVVADGYLGRLLDNDQVSDYLQRHHEDLYRQLAGLHMNIAADAGIVSDSK